MLAMLSEMLPGRLSEIRCEMICEFDFEWYLICYLCVSYFDCVREVPGRSMVLQCLAVPCGPVHRSPVIWVDGVATYPSKALKV